ncbi:MAG: hypothetical protein COB59_08735 [Rhodospirillaceae bacterium]|nr:MAG: hypothetical protein COB59_08735 [Rhodospirillaceae bacterium]
MSLWFACFFSAYADSVPPAPRTSPVGTVETAALSTSTSEKTSSNGAPAPVHRSIDEELLLEVRMGNLILADALPGYLNGSSLLLPLGYFVEVLEFPIQVDPTTATASGWFIRENKLFYLNVQRASVVVEGRQNTFDTAMIELHSDDIYVDIRLLSQWFPLDITFNVSNMLVGLKSREALPFEKKLSRDKYQKRIFGGKDKQTDGKVFPFVDTPHKLLSWPMLSVDTNTYLTKPKNGRQDFATDYNIMATADAGFMNTELFVAGNNRNKITESRLRFERKAPDGRVLGDVWGHTPLTELTAGDIYTPEVSLVARSQIGRGFSVSSIPLDAPAEFDKISLTGDLPLGWDIELFRNEVLIAFQSSSDDSRYTFSDIPLLFGVNVLKLMFYGPQGQVREEIKQFRVGAGLVKPGSLQYRISSNQHDARVLYKRRITKNTLDGEARIIGEAQFGITQNITAGVNLSVLPSAEGQQRYIGLSSSTSFGNIYTRGDLIKQQGKGWAARVSGQTSWAGISIIGQHDYYKDFFSEHIAFSTDPLTSASKLRLDGSIPKTMLPRIPFGFTLDHSIRRSKARESRLSNRMSMAVGRVSLTNSLTGSLNKSSEGVVNKALSGSFLVGGRIQDVRVRGQVAYQVSPLKEISTMSLNGDWSITKEYQGRAGITRTLGTTNRTAYSLGINTAFDQVSAGLAFDYNNNQEMIGRMTLNFSFSRNPSDGGINMSRGNIATKGAMAAHVFLDNDANGVFSKGDEPLDGVGFTANNVPLKGRTSKSGYAYVAGIEPYKELTLEVDLKTLGDPYWIAQPGGIRVIPRPGTTGEYDFPVVSTGEIDGSAFRIWGDGIGNAAGVVVQLVNQKEDIVREMITAYDGFYLFDFVTPGEYTLRVSPDQLQKLKLVADQSHTISIKGNGTVVSGQDFVLR